MELNFFFKKALQKNVDNQSNLFSEGLKLPLGENSSNMLLRAGFPPSKSHRWFSYTQQAGGYAPPAHAAALKAHCVLGWTCFLTREIKRSLTGGSALRRSHTTAADGCVSILALPFGFGDRPRQAQSSICIPSQRPGPAHHLSVISLYPTASPEARTYFHRRPMLFCSQLFLTTHI